MIASLILLLAAATAEATPAAAPPAAPAAASGLADEAKFPEPLRPFLTAKAKDGSAILSAEDHRKLAEMPERTRQLVGTAIDSQILGSAAHLKILLSLDLPPQGMEVVLQDNCILCHSDPGNQKPRTLFSTDPKKQGSNPLLDLKEFVSDAHFRRGLSCSGCHGGKPTDESMPPEIAARWPKADARHGDRAWIPEFCARCHSDPTFMRGFNPTLPTDQLAKYKESRHGIALLEHKESRAAQCVSCHGVHGIRGPKSRKSTVFSQRIPDTCGACHANAAHMAGFKTDDGKPLPTDQVAKYKASVHGQALLVKGDLSAPACNGCHGSHSASPPAISSIAQVCRRCHAMNGQLFDGSKHKVAFEQRKWPECSTCHGQHDIQKPTDALIGNYAGTLCYDCHSVASKDNPKCNETAGVFRKTLDGLASGRAEVAPQEEKMSERGLDSEPLARAVSELDEALVQSRTRVHAFDVGTFQQAAAAGSEALGKARQAVLAGQEDFRFRRSGLLAALGFMGLLTAGIALKIWKK